MSTAAFLSAPPLSNTLRFANNSNPKSTTNIFISASSSSFNPLLPNPHKTPKPSYSSKPPRVPLCETNTPSPNKNNNIQSPSRNFSFLAEPLSGADSPIKMPTAPWMKSPLLLPANEVLDLSRTRNRSRKVGDDERNDRWLTHKESGGRGKQAMRKIMESITKLKETHDSEASQKETDEFEFRVPLEQVGEDENSKFSGRMPWAKEERILIPRVKKEKVVTQAELCLPEELLTRLRRDAARMTKWVKVKKAGVTQVVVDEIKMIWRKSELAMLKFDLPLCRNMDRAREIVEIKAGGLVIWSKKDTLVVYRGWNYQSSSNALQKLHSDLSGGEETSSLQITLGKTEDDMTTPQIKSIEATLNEKICAKDGVHYSFPSGISVEKDEGVQSINGTLYEREADRLLDGLGPRFVDWWRPKPLPVDADLLPEVVPDYRPPFRMCPPRVRAKLADDELTYLRKLARPLPTHFVLGRNKGLQGLAAAILKLWEKSLIAKIAVKWGAPNTNNEQMAWELKHLTGGVLILRNKFFIILYRGKDFLPFSVANLIADRETELRRFQLQEEAARWKAIESFYFSDGTVKNTSTVGTFSEFQDIQTKCVPLNNENRVLEVQIEAEKERLKKELRSQERLLYILKMKIQKSAKQLSKLNSAWRPSEQAADREMITEEERQCFQKMGLKMDRVLVLGRRGVFDGVIEGMHQHWKHREIVKVITMQTALSQIMDTARQLEIESDGILVSVEKLRKGYAIILYRGKNYRRPVKLVPENLLTKRAALQRSLEMQRIGSLKFFAYQRQQTISDLKVKLRDLQRRGEEIAQRESQNA